MSSEIRSSPRLNRVVKVALIRACQSPKLEKPPHWARAVKIRRADPHRPETVERDAPVAASARAETDARELADKCRIARVLEDEAARKAELDRRFANHKARQA